ncbi:EamA family transporter [Donghicola mangrovi]|uniref:DMT family transporter n=1 Tax=Donghicola mangrovi TaxID=2729614 RepID=A0A850QGJ5_9RHOB|nr:DMT family transporter [Donghicola mangrovi]NVO24951.1 DMT family transporter [Donghicola mangrovi]
MTHASPTPQAPTGHAALPYLFLAGSLTVQYVGAAGAKSLFALTGSDGATTLRVGFSALVLALVFRPWRHVPKGLDLRAIAIYGLTLGAMNLCVYRSIALIPIGIAVAIEVCGPLAVALAGCRRARDLIWVVLAATGLVLLLPIHGSDQPLSLTGIAYAFGAAFFWSMYIVFGKRASRLPARQTLSWGMMMAAAVTVPFGIANAGPALLEPHILLIGLGVAMMSSILPYSLEMLALRRLDGNVFSLIVSSSPAVAALFGFALLNEALTPLQCIAIACVIGASAGNTLTAKR